MAEPKVVFTFNAGAYAIDEDGDFFEDISGKWRRNSIRPDRMIGRELARLAARVKELEFGAHGVTADELRAENKRLREALERVMSVSAKDSGYVDYARWQMMMTIARQALAQTSPPAVATEARGSKEGE
jgi:hypothetical protein